VITALYNRYKLLRVGTGLLLVLLIGLKVCLPVFVSLKAAVKEVSASAEQGDTDDEKKTESTSSSEKEKEFASIYSNSIHHLIWFTVIVHQTDWYNYYQATHHSRISTPPPDLYLQSIA